MDGKVVRDADAFADTEAAIAFLEAELANGPRRSFDVEAPAEAAGISIETLARARHRIGVISTQAPGNPRRWRLPQGEQSWRSGTTGAIGDTSRDIFPRLCPHQIRPNRPPVIRTSSRNRNPQIRRKPRSPEGQSTLA